jgi:hypothetical protein
MEGLVEEIFPGHGAVGERLPELLWGGADEHLVSSA